MVDLPSKSAVELMLSAEKEMFGELAGTVQDVKSGGVWRGKALNSGDLAAVEAWLDDWIGGFNDDLDLIDQWLGGLKSGRLLDAVEAEKAMAQRLLDEATSDEKKLAGLAKRTLASWVKDLDGEVKAKQAIEKYLP